MFKKFLCLVLGHDFVNERKSLIDSIDSRGLSFHVKKYEESYSETSKFLEQDPALKKRCKRCGYSIDAPSHFIEIYKAKVKGMG